MVFLFFTMANIALPGTSSFVGEFLILAGAFQANTTVCFLAATGMVTGGCYSLWLFNRVAYANIKTQYIHQFGDINRREFATFLPLIILTLVMGVYPEIWLDLCMFQYRIYYVKFNYNFLGIFIPMGVYVN